MMDHDFGNVATLGHRLTAAARFAGAELGRATATVGAGNAGLVFVAAQLGEHMNGMVATVAPAAGRRTLLLDPAPSGGAKRIRYAPAAGDTAGDAAEGFGPALRQARATREAAAHAEFFRVGVRPTGDGSDPVAAGSDTFAGGAAPVRNLGFPIFESDADDGGFFAFDAQEPLVLRQFVANLGGSVAWTLSLVLRLPGGVVARTIEVASGTGANVVVTTPLIIPPCAALAFTADQTGLACCSVSYARRS